MDRDDVSFSAADVDAQLGDISPCCLTRKKTHDGDSASGL